MRNFLKLEEGAMFLVGIVLLRGFNIPVLWLIILFFTPDLGALGYLAGPRIGAITYNAFHHKAIAIALYFLGLNIEQPVYMIAGLIIFAHSSFDRVLGFGLKYSDSFGNTHLGMIGKQKA